MNKLFLEPLKHNLCKGIRVVNFAAYNKQSDPIFKHLRQLSFDKLYKLKTAKFMFLLNKETKYTTIGEEFLKTSLH